MRDRLSRWAKEAAKDPRRAPWPGQRVSVIVRLGAAFLSIAFLFAMVYVAFPYLAGNKTIDLSLQEAANAMLFVYCLALFGRVALTGRAPTGWLPWN